MKKKTAEQILEGLFELMTTKKIVERYTSDSGDTLFRVVKGKEKEYLAIMKAMIVGDDD